MSIPRNPLNFVTGETLTPTKLNVGFERMTLDLLDKTEKRFGHSDFQLEFSGLADTDAATSFVYLIKAPWAYEIESVELILYEPTGTVTLVSLASTVPGWETISVAPLGATTRARETGNFKAVAVANTEYSFTLSVASGGAYALDRCYAVIGIRADRGNAGVTYSTISLADAPRFAAAESVAAAKVNTGFTDHQTAVAANTACDRLMRIQVFSLRNIAVALATSDRDLRIPATARRFHSLDVVNLGAVGDNLTATLLDEAAATVVAVTVNGSGTPPAKTQGTSINDTQSNNTPTNSANDYKLRFTRAGAVIIPLGYAVLYTS